MTKETSNPMNYVTNLIIDFGAVFRKSGEIPSRAFQLTRIVGWISAFWTRTIWDSIGGELSYNPGNQDPYVEGAIQEQLSSAAQRQHRGSAVQHILQ